ncbi:BTAD domain-containing putative transcriptional regulator [Actinomadura sp. LOL_016]|uniref:BTAD domain-containing putative transcriptional regulator n=1 Tax=unclassified Actinomadura TaxID=2626254 RepID=UPI003A813C15
MTTTLRSRSAELLRGVGALLLFGVLLIGFPIGLHAVAGSPVPDRLPTWDELTATLMSPDTDQRLFLGTVRLLGWTAWLVFVLATCIETIGHLAGRPTPSLPRPARPLQLLVRDMVATATLAFSATATLTTPASAAHTITAAAPQASTTEGIEQTADASVINRRKPLVGNAAPMGERPDGPGGETYTVQQDDTLWGIADDTYGSGHLYPEIFNASRPLDQPPGTPALTDPEKLYPGQRLHLPEIRTDSKATEEADRSTPPEPANTPNTPRPSQEGGSSGTPPTSTKPTGHSTATPSSPVPRHAEPSPDRPSTPTPRPAHETDDSFTITLRSGSYIGFGLATALSIALAATRLHRRRSHTAPGSSAPTASPAPDPATPKPVAEARKAHLDTYADRDAPIPSDAELVAQDTTTPAPDHVTLGSRAGRPVALPLAGLSLGLSGEAAHATARAVATELLAKSHRDRVELLIPRPDAEELYPTSDITAHTPPGLTITPTLNAALTHLETEILRRARLLETTDQPDLASLRATDPAEPLPVLLLIGSVTDQAAPALQAILGLGRRYGIGALILGPWPTGTTVHLNTDATVHHAIGTNADTLTGARLFNLATADADAMLQTLHTATGANPTAPPSQTNDTDTAAATPGPASRPEPDLVPPPRPTSEERPRPARLQVLGPVTLYTADGPVTTGLRRSARDLLAYLALHPNGITRDQGVGALWPDHNPDTATTQFNTAISNIRKVLRTATGLREPMFVLHTTGRYRLDHQLIDVDLWNLTTTLNNAKLATTDTDRITALTPIADLYTADFADNLTHDWAEAHREYLRRTATDALTHLAQFQRDDYPDRALATIEQAIHLDPYAESLYRAIMQLQIDLGHPDAAHRTYRLLTTRLADLDTEPTDQTHRLLSELHQR